MMGISVSSKGQITLPKDVRDDLNIKQGDRVYFVADGDRAIMVPLKGDFWSLRGALKKYTRGKKMDWKGMRKQMHKSRAARVIGILAEARENKK